MNNTLPILYSFRRCPFAMRARMAIIYAATPVVLREIQLKAKPACMLQYSPKGTVPVLILPCGKVIDESLHIMHWALEQSSDAPLSGYSQNISQRIEQLIVKNDTAFKPWLDKYKYADRHPEYPADYYRAQAQEFLTELDTLLSGHRYLMANHQTLADIAIFPFIRQCALVDKDWFDHSQYHQLKRWLQEQIESPVFITAMQKFPVWENGDAVIVLK